MGGYPGTCKRSHGIKGGIVKSADFAAAGIRAVSAFYEKFRVMIDVDFILRLDLMMLGSKGLSSLN